MYASSQKKTKKPLLSTRGITQCAHIFPISLLPSKLFYFSTSLSQLWSQNKLQPFLYIVKTLSAATCSFALSKTLTISFDSIPRNLLHLHWATWKFSILFVIWKHQDISRWNMKWPWRIHNVYHGNNWLYSLLFFFPTFRDKAKFLIKGCQLEEQALFWESSKASW